MKTTIFYTVIFLAFFWQILQWQCQNLSYLSIVALQTVWQIFSTARCSNKNLSRGAETAVGQGGAVKELRAMETCKKQKNVTNYACFCTATTLTSKRIAEIIDNHSEFDGALTAAVNLFQINLDKPLKLPMILLWKSTSAPVAPFRRKGNTYVISPLSNVPGITMMLLYKGTRAPVAPLSKGRGQCPRSGVPDLK